MKLKNIDTARHRNGVFGTPFEIVLFTDRSNNKGRRMLGILFEAEGQCAVLDVAKLAEGDIAFGSNSWRGDDYEPDLRRAIAEQKTLIDSEVSGTGRDTGKPIVVVTVQGGLVSDVNATSPVTVVVEDWDCQFDKPFVLDFISGELTPDQEERVRDVLAENKEVPRPTQN